ncbi:MAG: fibronectin type III domain-containing protein [Muribaculaceae bacterium]|nr:fibronectin type III domain-containing protein [Muribaculaceae bacterium]
MKKFLLSAMALLVATVTFAQPTTVPVPTGDDIEGIYGSQLGKPVGQGFNFYDWGSGSAGQVYSVDGKETYMIPNLKWYGSQFGDFDASNKKFIHLDIYPMEDMELCIALISWNRSTNGNWGERGVNFTLTGGEWNSLDITMQDLIDRGGNFDILYQIKFVKKMVTPDNTNPTAADGFENGDGTKTFYVGNIYAYGTRVVDNENPVMVSAEATEVLGNQVTLTMNATDNNDKVTYIVTDATNSKTYSQQGVAGENTTLTVKGLNAETSYSWTVQAKDMAGNMSDNSITVNFTTIEGFKLTAAPVPTHSTDKYEIFSIYSDAYDKAAEAQGAFFNTWGSAGESFEEVQVDGDHIWKVMNFGYLGNEFTTTTDLRDYTVHMDLLATELTQIGLTPITQSGEASTMYNITAGEWTSLDIPMSAWSTLNAQYTFQFKWDRGNSASDLYIDNFYFYKALPPVESAVTFETAVDNATIQVLVDGEAIATGDVVAEGTEVTIVVTPEEGYEVKEVKVTEVAAEPTGTGAPRRAAGDDVTVTPGENNQYTFVMPANPVAIDVTVEASPTTAVTDLHVSAGAVKYVNAMGQVSNRPFKGVNIVIDGNKTYKVVK